ncbi:MAG: hypothetical protein K5868_03500 [Lachnospiraceae bacterium]|nr:hypothetical protein [Lachnospiraceae bacterium]
MRLFKGETLSDGIGLGRVLFLSRAPFASSDGDIEHIVSDPEHSGKDSPHTDPSLEKEKLEKAVLMAEERLDRLSAKENVGEEVRSILFAERMILGDKEVREEIFQRIEEGSGAVDAVRAVSAKYISAFSESKDPLLKGRVADVEDACVLVTGFLREIRESGSDERSGKGGSPDDIREDGSPKDNTESGSKEDIPQGPFIIVAESLTPSEITEYLCEDLKGIVVFTGSYLSHTSIIARTHEIPMLLVKDTDLAGTGGQDAIIDSGQGCFFTEPDMDMSAFYRRRADKNRMPLKKEEHQPMGMRIYSNITGIADAQKAFDDNSAGIGLFRTEFLYMGRKEPPSEEESIEVYKRVLELFQERPVTVRTFDLGGDKEAEYLKGRNELTGLRGIRLAIREQDLLITQLRALMRSNIYGNLRVMIPLVSGKTDVLNTRALIRAAKRSLERDRLLYRDFPLGIMVETVSAVQVIDELAGLSKFFSIGTNDLRFDLLGKDRFKDKLTEEERVNEKLTDVIKEITAAARQADIPVGICGETEGLLTESLGIDYISR